MNRTLLALPFIILAACASPPADTGIHHLVFLRLTDPGRVAELDRDCRELAAIPGVTAYWSGRPSPSERPVVVADYDLVLHLVFADEAAYAAYEAHPIHVRLVDAWRPHLADLKVRDAAAAPAR